MHALKYICMGVYMCVSIDVCLHANASIHVPQLIPKSIPEQELVLFFLIYSQGSQGLESLSNSLEAEELVMMGSELTVDLVLGFPALDYLVSKLRVKSK